MQRITAKILSNLLIADGYYQLDFLVPPVFPIVSAGQFLTLRVGESISPLLRRPFAFASFDPTTLKASIIYERRGTATQLLTGFREGDPVDILGPLGNSFTPPQGNRRPVLIAGGIGIGPMLFLYDQLSQSGLKPLLLVGARNAAKIPTGLLPKDTFICTDDGSLGFNGTVLQGIQSQKIIDAPSSELYLCGPHGMMKAVAKWAGEQSNRHCWVSMEQTMACAVGACMGCVVPVHHQKKYARVCTDGPIFPAEMLDWA